MTFEFEGTVLIKGIQKNHEGWECKFKSLIVIAENFSSIQQELEKINFTKFNGEIYICTKDELNDDQKEQITTHLSKKDITVDRTGKCSYTKKIQ